MAQGDFIWFDQAIVNVCNADVGHDFGATPNVIKCALISSATTPAATTANPHWGATGTDLSVNEVSSAGSYTAGGNTCATPSVTLNAGRAEFDWGDPAAWAANASNGTDAKWAIIYDDTATNKPCLGYIDLGTVFDMTTGTLTITMGTPAAYIDQA